MPFYVEKCHILQVGTRNLESDYEMSGIHCVKDVDDTITSNLKFSQQCKEAAGKTNRMLVFMKKKFLQELRYDSTSMYDMFASD